MLFRWLWDGTAKAMLDSRFVAPVTDAIADSCGVMCSADLGGRHTYEMYIDRCKTSGTSTHGDMI